MIIKPDTKFFLAESFKELSQKKSVDKITVKEIVKNCGFTSPTFYNHFRDKYDLIAWIYSSQAEKIMNKIDGENYFWSDSLRDGIYFFLDNKDFLQNLIFNTSGQDSFINYVANFNVKILSDFIKNSQGIQKLPDSIEISIKIYCYGTVCTICEFLIKPQTVSTENFIQYPEDALPKNLKDFLYKIS